MATTITGLEATEIHSIENLSSADKYKIEWEQLLLSLSDNLETLRHLAFNGDLKVSKFRSICWSLLLRVLNENSSTWQEQRKQQRKRYNKLKNEFVKNPHKMTNANDDPLSQSKQSVWNQYFGDQELFSVIKQDVVRTFPGVEFFHKYNIQEAMTNILFYYAREHPYMCYRQGMHEILAPILFVMHSDHQSLLHFVEITKPNEIDKILLDVLDPEYLEADSYSLFSRVMSSIESYYRITNVIPTSGGYFPMQIEPVPFDDSTGTTEVEVIGQLNFIRDKILAKEDLHLHNHFLKLDIPLHIFGIRWLRLLFGREFPLQDLLILWDAIFADSDRFELPNFILVAMLIRIRDKLLLSDYTTCLTYLMRYPNNVDIGLILKHALHMQMPKKFERPNEAFVYIKIKQASNKRNNKQEFSTLPRQQSMKQSDSNSKHLFLSKISDKFENRNRSSSLTNDYRSSSDSILKDIKMANTMNSNQLDIPSSDLKIVDGYRENSLEALHAELQLAQNVMIISRQKLKKYLFIVKQHIPSEYHSDELNQALTGIEELCSFMDVKFLDTNDPIPQVVDPALEAAEINQIKLLEKKVINRKPHTNIIPTNNGAQNSFENLSETLSKESETLKTIPSTYGVDELRNMHIVVDDIHINSSRLNLKTRYEIPDNSFMRNSNKLFGTKKDFELKLFRTESIEKDESGGVPIVDPLGIREN